MAKDPNVIPRGERTHNLGEKYRTCSYCDIAYRTQEAFAEHWKTCPVRVDLGEIKGIRRKEKGCVTLTFTAAQLNVLYDLVNNNMDMLCEGSESRVQRNVLKKLREALYETE